MVRFRRKTYKRPYKKRIKKRTYRKKTSATRMPLYAMFRNGPPTGFPNKLRCKLKYFETPNITSTTGGLTKHIWNANSIFDPNDTGTGHQPLYHDTFASLYDHYAVISSKIIITIVNRSTTDSALVSLGPEDDNSASSTTSTLVEQVGSKSKVLTPLSGSKSEQILTGVFGAKKVLSIDPFTSQSYKTAFGSNPSELSTWVLSVTAFNAATLTCDYTVQIIYDVLFSELSTPTQS